METNTDEPLDQAITTLTRLIELVGSRGLSESALFLGMARLQLQLDLHGITENEFISFCDAIETGAFKPQTERPHPRPRREGELRGMHRAWKCPNGIKLPRGGRNRA